MRPSEAQPTPQPRRDAVGSSRSRARLERDLVARAMSRCVRPPRGSSLPLALAAASSIDDALLETHAETLVGVSDEYGLADLRQSRSSTAASAASRSSAPSAKRARARLVDALFYHHNNPGSG